MSAILELILGVSLLFITIGTFLVARPGTNLNSWLLKHGAFEAMFPLFIITTFALAVAAFAMAIQ